MSKVEVVLLDCWASPFCMRAKIALEEKGVQHERREENLFGGKSELLLKSNPIHQKVPVLLHNGKPISESTTVVGYIDEVWSSSTPLLRTCPYERAQAQFWADFFDKKFIMVISMLERYLKLAEKYGQAKEGKRGDKSFYGGDAFGFADIIAIGLTSWFVAYEKFGGFKVEDHCPKFSAWMKRCMQRETVAKVLPDPEKIYEFVITLRNMHGIE
ncbi:hypothetical protein ACJW31_01G220200 [Castanea mollissima]